MAKKNTYDEEQLTDSAYYILLALVQPMHGYGIMQYVEELTDQEVQIGPATLYTILKKMEAQEWITLGEEDSDRRKTYTITAKGRGVLSKDISRRIKMAEHGKAALPILEGGHS